MHNLIIFWVFWSLLILLGFCPILGANENSKGEKLAIEDNHMKQKHIVLMGASIGKHWDIPSLPERIDNKNYYFEYLGTGLFDKSDRLKAVLERKENKPDAVFIKECAAYFPVDKEYYRGLVKQWIDQCKEKDVVPIPATVVPVTRLHSFKLILIDIIRGRNPLKYGNPFSYRRNKAILEYNDWIREYCEKQGLSYLDLEATLRYSEKNRFLREDLAYIDGLHLIRKAYKLLDQIVIPTLETVNWENK